MRKILELIRNNEVYVFILLGILFLRIPNLFEPYWYGDEAIYLTVGTGLRHGLLLYRDIIDHKTPLIYLLAMTPSVFWFKLLFMGWMAGTFTAFYVIAKKFITNGWARALSLLIFALLTTLPWFEGHVANGELFLMGFMLVGLAYFVRSPLYTAFEHHHKTFDRCYLPMFITGIFFSLGILTKVPAIFDAAAVAIVFGFVFLSHMKPKMFIQLLMHGLALLAGIAIPVALSVAFFALNNATDYYAQFGWLYNFRYSNSFSVPVEHPILKFLFTMTGKAFVVAVAGVVVVLLQKVLRPTYRFVFMWCVLALFATLISSRPYPHYFIQMIPPVALLAGLLFTKWKLVEKVLGIAVIAVWIWSMFLIQVGVYGVSEYYSNFFDYITKKVTLQQYRQRFNYLMDDTYAVATYLKQTTMPTDRLFIWGTNPMLYALSQRVPAGRFTVSFHIKDFDAYEETIDSIRKTKPPVMVVMKDEDGKFDAFYSELRDSYAFVADYQYMTVYRRVLK